MAKGVVIMFFPQKRGVATSLLRVGSPISLPIYSFVLSLPLSMSLCFFLSLSL